MKRNGIPFAVGVSILVIALIMAFFPSLFTDYGRKEMFSPWQHCSGEHVLGTNGLGYDIWTELVYGAADTVKIGLSASFLALAAGVVAGMISSSEGAAGAVFSFLTNVFALMPKLVILIVMSSFLGSSSGVLIILIAAFSWVGTARAVRGRMNYLSTAPFIENARVLGYGRGYIMLHHYARNLKDVLLSRFLTGVTSCIMMESTLSFLGLGDLYHPTWGTMISFAWKRGAMLRHAYNYLLTPGIAIALLSFGFYLVSLRFEKTL